MTMPEFPADKYIVSPMHVDRHEDPRYPAGEKWIVIEANSDHLPYPADMPEFEYAADAYACADKMNREASR